MKKIPPSIMRRLKKLNVQYFLFGFLFIFAGFYTWVIGKLPRGGIIYDDNLKIFYGIIWFVLGLACVFVGVRKKQS